MYPFNSYGVQKELDSHHLGQKREPPSGLSQPCSFVGMTIANKVPSIFMLPPWYTLPILYLYFTTNLLQNQTFRMAIPSLVKLLFSSISALLQLFEELLLQQECPLVHSVYVHG